MNSIFSKAKWIWRRQDGDMVHQYVCFRKKLPDNDIAGGKLYIAADTDFIAYINGLEIGRGQFSDFPKEKTYSEFQLPLSIRHGRNVLCVLAYYCGANFSTYTPGRAGMIAMLRTGDWEIVSDDSWKCIQSPSFQSGGQAPVNSWNLVQPLPLQSGDLPPLTTQLGFVTKFDARNDFDWLNPDFDDSIWPAAEIRGSTVGGFWEKLSPRPVPPLLMGNRLPTKIVMQGSVLRNSELNTFADTVASDLLGHYDLSRVFEDVQPADIGNTPTLDGSRDCHFTFRTPEEPANGWFIIADIGAESVGLIDIELDAAAGTVIDISHGEHLLDGKVRNKIGARNFTDRYVCRNGLNCYLLPFRRIGGRYIQLNITNASKPVSIRYIGIRPLNVQLPDPGYFHCGDILTERTRTIGIRTLELCMHEHYEDCPWREQALYAYDSRNQMLYGYYVWGNYAFAAASLNLLGKGIRPDGLLELCAPAKRDMTIPIFSFVWISELYEHWLHCGDNTLFRKFSSQIEFMLDKVFELLNPENGLYRLSPDKNLWHFYEWSPGLDVINCQEDEYHAPYNMYFYEALLSCSAMMRLDGRGQKADEYLTIASSLKQAINRVFWDNTNNCYASKLFGEQVQEFHEHVQFLSIYNQLVPDGKLSLLLETLRSRKMEAVTFSAMPYMLRSMMPISPDTREYVSTALSRNFDQMIFSGATSLWETKLGAADFSGAGSLCHAWSSLPVYYYHAWVLGIKPLEPGFRKFSISPYPDRFSAAQGSIPTPSGFIDIEWLKTENGLRIKIKGPENLYPILSPLEEAPVISATYNGIEFSSFCRGIYSVLIDGKYRDKRCLDTDAANTMTEHSVSLKKLKLSVENDSEISDGQGKKHSRQKGKLRICNTLVVK